jgi:hypothetical protein
VSLVAVGGEVEGEEGGPDQEERPDVGVELQGQWVVQARLLDLRVVDERHLVDECRLSAWRRLFN